MPRALGGSAPFQEAAREREDPSEQRLEMEHPGRGVRCLPGSLKLIPENLLENLDAPRRVDDSPDTGLVASLEDEGLQKEEKDRRQRGQQEEGRSLPLGEEGDRHPGHGKQELSFPSAREGAHEEEQKDADTDEGEMTEAAKDRKST